MQVEAWSKVQRLIREHSPQQLVDTLPFTGIEVCIGSVVFYIATIYMFWPQPGTKPQRFTPLKKSVVFLHNLFLAIYSITVFVNTGPQTIHCFTSMGFRDAIDRCPGLNDSNMVFWGWTFFLSKIYEFGDTYVHLWRGSKPSFLQMFHHVGAVWGMWLPYVTGLPAMWTFIVLNSFIHTIMYTYYCLTTIGIRPPGKVLITNLQIVQFFTGLVVAYEGYWKRNPPLNTEQFLALGYVQVYGLLLILLFGHFYYHTYLKRTKEKHKSKVSKRD